LESELFGHEKGAFTGAIAPRMGRFELAHRGTLVLDEIGDLPLELQPKLLRVLHERAFERLGSTRTVHTDARLIVATNVDLAQMVAEKHFRSDLYYRLHVFPIVIPPLRERREDIPLLVRYFVHQYARRMNKRIETIPPPAMTAMTEYHWPGNVRELEHFIERAVILSREPELQPPLAELLPRMPSSSGIAGSANHSVTLRDAEREHTLRALEETRGVLGGPGGAAARLGLKRTTGESATVADLPAGVAVASAGGPPPSGAPGSLPVTGLDAVERDAIVTAILTYHGNLTQVARALRIAKSTLYLKITKYGLDHVLQTVRPSDR
jgi:formate hydrogenlyase transcriptional activator